MHDFAQEDSKNPYTFHVVFQMQSTLDIHGCYFLPLQFCWKKKLQSTQIRQSKTWAVPANGKTRIGLFGTFMVQYMNIIDYNI